MKSSNLTNHNLTVNIRSSEFVKQSLIGLERDIYALQLVLLPRSHGGSKGASQGTDLRTISVHLGGHLAHAVHFGHFPPNGAGEILVLMIC